MHISFVGGTKNTEQLWKVLVNESGRFAGKNISNLPGCLRDPVNEPAQHSLTSAISANVVKKGEKEDRKATPAQGG